MIHTEEGVAKVASDRAERPWARRNLGFQPALFEFRHTLFCFYNITDYSTSIVIGCYSLHFKILYTELSQVQKLMELKELALPERAKRVIF